MPSGPVSGLPNPGNSAFACWYRTLAKQPVRILTEVAWLILLRWYCRPISSRRHQTMLDVIFSVDVEIWCDGWQGIDQKFPRAFERYIYGPTPSGSYGLPFQLNLLREHGLAGVFFVEPLFSTRFGRQPLAEIVGLVRESGQDVQLHLHTEWVDEASKPLVAISEGKRQYLQYFSLADQTTLIAHGKQLLRDAGGGEVNAFRAGSFGFNIDTLRALRASGILFDSSYNATRFGPESGVMPGVAVVDSLECEGVYEYPMTVFDDGTGALRHVQLTACSFREIESLLWAALEARRNSFVMLSHNFELLNETKSRSDDVVVKRFRKLCAFLDRNRDSFRVGRFSDLRPQVTLNQPRPLRSTLWRTGARMVEQAYRRRFR